MKTPMQELIETFKEIQKDQDPFSVHEAIELAESMLEKEKAVIMDSYWDGGQDIPIHISRCEEYYNKTFKTKER